jgi:MFS family permease
MNRSFSGMWKNSNFIKLWAGQTISLFGSQITVLALPLLAANVLQATPGQMGLLGFVQYVPWLLVGLFAGVWVDRLQRRPIMLIADILRAILLALIPLTAWLGWMRIEYLYLVGFLLGICTVFFDIAYVAILPSLVSRDQLVEGNSKLQISVSASETAGPGLAGVLVQVISAPIAIGLDALSFVISALSLAWIRGQEVLPPTPAKRPSVRTQAWEGLRLSLRHPLLRGFIGCSTTGNLFIDMHTAVYLLYLTRELGISPAAIGLIYAFGGVGGVLGASIADRLTRFLGTGPAAVWSQLCHGLCMTALPFVALFRPTVPLLTIVHAVWGFTSATYLVPAMSLRQAITPDHLQGRITASQRVLTFGVSPLGFLIGGFLGEWIGLWPTLLLAGVGLIFSNLWLSLSPLPHIHEQNAVPKELAIAEA